ncbi:MAG: hypothetical protein ACTHMR_12135 [Thermomicrobiales bacterium]
MKRFMLVILLVGAMLAATGMTARAAATTTVQNYTIPIGGGGPTQGCTEMVNIQGGSLHAVIIVVTDNTGGFHVSGTFNFQDVRGGGLTTGTTYVAVRANSQTSSLSSDGARAEITETVTRLLVSQGAAPNFLVHTVYHITYQDGQLVATVDNVTSECLG